MMDSVTENELNQDLHNESVNKNKSEDQIQDVDVNLSTFSVEPIEKQSDNVFSEAAIPNNKPTVFQHDSNNVSEDLIERSIDISVLKVDDSRCETTNEKPVQEPQFRTKPLEKTSLVSETSRSTLANEVLIDREQPSTNTTVGLSPKSSIQKNKMDHSSSSSFHKKAISFPENTYISGYFEPPDPWKNAPVWNTDELITAYRKSCELHGCKPITKLLQQLHTVTPGKREDLFTLKGEKLDSKQCESIEEIFRRVQFKLIDLEASHLDDESAVALFDMIEYYESACQLNVSFNKNIGARAWQSCSRLVRRTPTLTYLDIRGCEMTERTIPIFGRALKLGCHLTILHMESMSLSGRTLIILVAAVKNNETLQELFLAENKFVPTDGAQIGNLLRANHKLQLLDLRNNHLQDVGTNHICEGLLEQISGHGLRTLVLWNNQITYQAMPALGRALAMSSSLETLNIGHNNITNEGIHLLKDGLLKTNSLLRLGLQGTKISDEGAVALAEFIADSMILLRIDIHENEIKTGGLMALSHAMRVNTSVTRIDLDKDTKKESGMKDYAEQQNRLQRDILTFQQRNVLAAIEREEQERQRLEEMTLAAEASRNKLKSQEETESTNESFTVIQEEEIPETSAETDSDSKKIEDVPNQEETVEAQVKSDDKISVSRPNVLFSAPPALEPEETLDSPTDEEVPRDPLMDKEVEISKLKMPDRKKLLASTPPSELLLSPQYYPKQLAKKIFSVSRVDEPTSNVSEREFSSPSETPELEEYESCETSHSENDNKNQEAAFVRSTSISPNSLFRDLENETVKQIVEGSTTRDLIPEQTSATNCQGSENSEEVNSSEHRNISCSEHQITDSLNSDSFSYTENISEDNILNSVSETSFKNVEHTEHLNTFSNLSENLDQLQSDTMLTPLTAECETIPEDEMRKENEVRGLCNGDLRSDHPDETHEDLLQQIDNNLRVTEIPQQDHLENEYSNKNPSSVSTLPSVTHENIEVKNTNSKSLDGEAEEEPWLTVDDSEISIPTRQPDFFTTLTTNGFTQELASALTSFDTTTENLQETAIQPADEFEKELDSLLEMVKSDKPWPLKES